jgi:calmodulin
MQRKRVVVTITLGMLAVGCFLLLAHAETHAAVESMEEGVMAMPMPPQHQSDVDTVDAVLDDTDAVLKTTGETLNELTKDMKFDDLSLDDSKVGRLDKKPRSHKRAEPTMALILDEEDAGNAGDGDAPPAPNTAAAASQRTEAQTEEEPARNEATGTPVVEGGKGEGEEEKSESMFGHHYKMATVAVCVVLLLIAMSVLFEIGKDLLFESTSKNFKPVLTSMFAELTLLGFIGLIMFCLGQAGALKALSEDLFADEPEGGELLDEMCEVVHMALFLLMVLFLGMVIIWTKMAQLLQSEWKAWQRHINEHGNSSVMHIADILDHDGCGGWCNFFLGVGDTASRKELFTITRLGFIYGQMHMKGSKALSVDFDFAEYLSIHVGETLAELVEIPIASWALVGLSVIALYIGYALTSFEVHVGLMVLYSYALALLLRLTSRHLRDIREAIIEPYLADDNLAAQQIQQEENADGLGDEDDKTERFGGLFCPVLEGGQTPNLEGGKTPNVAATRAARSLDKQAHSFEKVHEGKVTKLKLADQRSLFWFNGMSAAKGSMGTKTANCFKPVLNIIRMCMLLQAALWATFMVAYLSPLVRRGFLHLPAEESCNLPHGLAVAILLAIVPPVPLQLLMMPGLVANLGISTGVSTLWRQPIVERVLRWQTASKSIRALKLVAQMRISAKHAKSVQTPSHGLSGAASQTVSELVIQEMNTSGKLAFTVQDLSDFLQAHSIADASAAPMEARYMMARGDINGDGLLDQDEVKALVSEMGNTQGEPSAEEVAKHLFAHSGKKTTESLNPAELHQLLESLSGTTVTEEDIKALFQGADTDGSGGLDMQELAALLSSLASGGEKSGAQALLTKSISAVARMERTLTMVRAIDQMAHGKDQSPAGQGMGVRQRTLLREIFDRFDDDGKSDGTLSEEEFRKFLDAVGAVDPEAEETADQQVSDIVALLDADRSGSVSFDEFIGYAEANDKAMQSGQEFTADDICDELFSMLDRDKSGYISVEEIKQEIDALGMVMSMEDVYSVVKEADDDDDIYLDREEFKQLMDRLSNT